MLPERGPARLALWGVGALAVALVRNRLWASPNLAFFTTISDSLGRNPFEGSPLDGSYLLTNLLPVSIARALGQTAAHEYARLHLVVLLMGLGLVVAATRRRFGYEAARAFCVLSAAAPVVAIGFEWLGQPDAFTVPLAFGVVIAQRRWTVATLAVLLGLTHAEGAHRPQNAANLVEARRRAADQCPIRTCRPPSSRAGVPPPSTKRARACGGF